VSHKPAGYVSKSVTASGRDLRLNIAEQAEWPSADFFAFSEFGVNP
jgi:hypothetical protein